MSTKWQDTGGYSSMNRIDATFQGLKKQGRKALIPFVTAGDAGLDTTEQLVLQLESAGANIIELGVPFSDPIAEGPVIQEASVRSLKNGTKLVDIFHLVKRLRKKTQIPLLLMLYINSIFGFGTERFFQLCAECGVDGVIVPDMPFEERDEIQAFADRAGVYSIRMVAPTSHERIAAIARSAQGFLYCVSSTGVTGTRKTFTTDFDAFFGTISQYARVPYAVGFGISGPEQAKKMSAYCDGVIVGSAIVKMVAQYGKDCVEPVGSFAASLRAALDQ